MTGLRKSARGNAPFVAATIAVVAGIAALLFVPTSAGASGQRAVRAERVSGTADDPNETAYYDTRGYGICTRIINPGTPYNLPAVQPGYYWTLLVVKAGPDGPGQFAQYPDPLPGAYYHPSSDPIERIIRCKESTSVTTTAQPPTTTTSPDPCGPYTPRNLVADKSRANPGELVTVSGLAGGGDTLTIKLSSYKITTRTLGTRMLPLNGVFTIGVILPDDIPVGATYTITLVSSYCARSGSVGVYVDPEVRSGCAPSNLNRVLIRGQLTNWKMVSGSPTGFDRTKPLTLSLQQRVVSGYTTTLWTGMWGANGDAPITVPLAAPKDRYYVVQSGTNKATNLPKSEVCQVRVADDYTTFLTASRGGGSDAWRQPVQIGVAGLISAMGLLRLRVRHGLGRRRRAAS